MGSTRMQRTSHARSTLDGKKRAKQCEWLVVVSGPFYFRIQHPERKAHDKHDTRLRHTSLLVGRRSQPFCRIISVLLVGLHDRCDTRAWTDEESGITAQGGTLWLLVPRTNGHFAWGVEDVRGKRNKQAPCYLPDGLFGACMPWTNRKVSINTRSMGREIKDMCFG